MAKPAIYTIEPPKPTHNRATLGGLVTVYDLKRMTSEEIERHGLTYLVNREVSERPEPKQFLINGEYEEGE